MHKLRLIKVPIKSKLWRFRVNVWYLFKTLQNAVALFQYADARHFNFTVLSAARIYGTFFTSLHNGFKIIESKLNRLFYFLFHPLVCCFTNPSKIKTSVDSNVISFSLGNVFVENCIISYFANSIWVRKFYHNNRSRDCKDIVAKNVSLKKNEIFRWSIKIVKRGMRLIRNDKLFVFHPMLFRTNNEFFIVCNSTFYGAAQRWIKRC